MTAIIHLVDISVQGPSLQDNTADLDRLRKAVEAKRQGSVVVVPYSRLSKVAKRFRAAGFKGQALVCDINSRLELVDFFAQSPSSLIGMALDLGTTRLEASLVNLLSGEELARSSRENSQIGYGSDILSRIHFSAKDDGLDLLHRAVINDINILAADLTERAGIEGQGIRALSVAGNTTMIHFFLRLDPYHICREPYIPMVNSPSVFYGHEIGIDIHPAAPVWIFPSVGSYFGGDLISGILACGLDEADKTSMFIDVGTNAEVIVGNREWLIACAGAAGPALEGGVARMGMRAGPGAIEHVEVDGETGVIRYRTIDGGPPKGICGSGIIDLVAGLYLARMIDIRGKFRVGKVGDRLVRRDEGNFFIVAPASESADGEPVLLGQVDLDALMRSKAAMYSILTTLISQVGLRFEDLDRIYVAGAFGQHIDPRQAIVLGMLPALPLSTYVPIGNSSLTGARQVLLDADSRRRCLDVVRKITYVELNVNQEFMIRFSGSRFIPHTDHTLFPSVPFYNET